MPKLRSKLFLAAIAVMVVPVLILGSELAVRLFSKHLDPLEVFISSPQLRADTQGDTTRGLFEFDPLLTWRLKPDLRGQWWDFTPVSTNSAHLRLDHEVGAKAGLRVVCLGDSVTFGYRVPVAPEVAQPEKFDATEQPYPHLLESMLKERLSGRSIEVLPLACPGYSSTQGLAWLRRDFAALKPDLVVACFGFNDVRAAGLPDRMTTPQGPQVFIRGLMAHSQLLLHLAQSAQQKRAPLVPPIPEPRTSEAEYVANFASMATLCQEQGGAFAIILPIYRDPNTPGDYPEGTAQPGDLEEATRVSQYRAALRADARIKALPTLEVTELTEAGWPGNAQYFGERIHPNAAGHRLLAERLTTLIVPILEKRK